MRRGRRTAAVGTEVADRSDGMLSRIAETNYPRLIVEVLIVERRNEVGFDAAWAIAVALYPPSAYGFGKLAGDRAGSVESPFSFLKRHMRAAYDGVPAAPYCAADCTRLAVIAGYCETHAEEEAA